MKISLPLAGLAGIKWRLRASVRMVVLNSESRYPWTLGLMAYQGQFSTSWQLVLAFITLTILPTIVMFLMAQRYIVAGLTAGAVKA